MVSRPASKRPEKERVIIKIVKGPDQTGAGYNLLKAGSFIISEI